jgi:hypothetical protein
MWAPRGPSVLVAPDGAEPETVWENARARFWTS